MEKADEHRINEKLAGDKLKPRDVTNATSLKTKQLTNEDECVNDEDICNNIQIMQTINKTDCNVVIDADTQSKQQQQPEQPPPKTYGCVHYKRKAKFVVSHNKCSIRFKNDFELVTF